MSAGQKETSKPINSSENQQSGHRKIGFCVESGELQFILKIPDTRHTWNFIPLGTVPSAAKGAHPKAVNITVPVIPLCYTTPDCDPQKAALPRPGWLYVFRQGKLWREYAVTSTGYYSDVNLKENQKNEVRQATGTFDSRVQLPYKEAGQTQTIEMAYSEVQWSWARINKLQSDSELRRQRMQQIDLSGYGANFPTLPANDNKARVENIRQAPEIYSLALQRQNNIPVVYLHDPLRIAKTYIDAFFTVESELAEIVEGLPQLKPIEGRDAIKDFSLDDKQAYYRAAVLAYKTFFDPKLAKRSRKFLVKGVVTTQETDTPIGQIANELDRAYLEEILAVEKRKKLRARIREIKRIYVDFLEGRSNGQDIRAQHPDFIDINAALLDFASLEGLACIQLWDKVKDLIGFLNHDPSVLDSAHDIAALVAAERPEPDADSASRYLESLLTPEHPLHKALFPTARQIDIYTENLDADLDRSQKPEPADGSGEFRPAAFAAALAASRRPPIGVDEKLKYILSQSEKIIADIVSSFQRQWQQALKNQSTVTIEPLLRLVKGAKNPELAGMHLVKAGSTLDGQIVIDGKLRIWGGLNRHQRRAASAASETLADDFIKVVDPRTDTVIGSQKISDLGNFKGVSPKITEQSWAELWGKSGKVGNQFKIVQAHTDLIVVPETSPYVVKFHNPEAVSSASVSAKVKALGGLSKTLPPLVAVMEGCNLWQSFSVMVKKRGETTGKEFARAVASLPYLAYATTDAIIKIGGEEAVANRLAKSGEAGRIGSKIVRDSIKIFGQEVKIFGALGSGVAGLAAVMSTWEMIASIQLGDDDAAFGHGMAVAGSIGVALAGLGASGMTVLAGFGPFGWAFLGVAILGSVLAYAFTDSDLEKWAKHGAFSKNIKSRMSQEYNGKQPRYLLERYMGMLMNPSITMKKDISTGTRDAGGNLIPDIVVEMLAPGFEPDLSTLDIRVTLETGQFDVRTLALLSGKQQCQAPYRIEQLYADEQNQTVIGVRYRFRLMRPQLGQWRARARHITKDQVILPLVKDAKFSAGDGMAASHPTTSQPYTESGMMVSHGSGHQKDLSKTNDDAIHINTAVQGWVYAELES